MNNNDQAAVEALCKIKHEIRGRSVLGTWSKKWGIRVDGARAILDAIRKGEVPGVCIAEPLDALHQSVERLEDINALRAEVERLKAYSEAADKALELACKTRNAAVDATQIVCSERDHLLEKVKEYEGRAIGERCRADKATAERDRLAGLLDDVVTGVETLLLSHWPEMMRKVVKGAMVGPHGLAHVAARAALAEVGK